MSDLHAQLGAAKLAELLGHDTESEILDFKQVADLSDPSTCVTLAKDVLPWADTTTMTWWPADLARMALRAASISPPAFFTLDPPNFCTTTPTGEPPNC